MQEIAWYNLVTTGNIYHWIVGTMYISCASKFDRTAYLVNSMVIHFSLFQMDFDNFWEICGSVYNEHGINKNEFKTFIFKDGFNTGDIIILIGREPEKIDIGDVIVFDLPVRPWKAIYFVQKPVPRITGLKIVAGHQQHISL